MKKIVLLACALTLVACGNTTSASYNVFQWQFDRDTHTLTAKIVSAPDGKIVKEMTMPIDVASHGAFFYSGASDLVQYHAATDSIIFQIENYDDYLNEYPDPSLNFGHALFRTDFAGTTPELLLSEKPVPRPGFSMQGVGPMYWSAGGDSLAAVQYTKDTPRLVVYDLVQKKITKECTNLPDYQSSYVYGAKNEVMYVSTKTANRGKVFINTDSCAVRRETYTVPAQDDTGFSTGLLPYSLSPDGKWLAYRFFLVDAKTGQKKSMGGAPRSGEKEFDQYLSWSSDSKYIVYSSPFTGAVNIYDLEKDTTKKLPITAKNGTYFLQDSHDIYLHDYPNGKEKNTIFNIDSWSGKETTLPQGQILR